MITLVPSTNNNSDVYIGTLIRLNETNIKENYTRVYKVYKNHGIHRVMLVSLDSDDCKPLLYVVGVSDEQTHETCVVYRGTNIEDANLVFKQTEDILRLYRNSAAVYYIRCIYPHRKVIKLGKYSGTIVDASSPEAQAYLEGQAEPEEAGTEQDSTVCTHTHTTQQDTHNNNNKIIIYIISIIVCIVVCFSVGYYIGSSTTTPPVDREPTAQELIDRILQE